MTTDVTPAYYRATIGGEKADVYAICVAHEITNPALAHAIKYLVRAGKKPGESFAQACDKAKASIIRAAEIEAAKPRDEGGPHNRPPMVGGRQVA